jgi:hypothetical protein
MREISAGQYKWLRVPKAFVTPAVAGSSISATTVSSYQSSSPQTFSWDLSATSTNPKAPAIGIMSTVGGV